MATNDATELKARDLKAKDKDKTGQPEQPQRDVEDADSEAASGEDDAPSKPKKSWRRTMREHPRLTLAIAVATGLILVAGLIWWLNARQYQSTDDAFIDARSIAIGSQVAGALKDVAVNDNQIVPAGAVIARIDDAIYRAQLAQAAAQSEQAQANIENLDAQIDEQRSRIDLAEGQVTEAQAALKFSQEENARYTTLVQSGSGTQQRFQQATSDLAQKQASFAGAQANAVSTRKQLVVLQTQRNGADAQLKAAQANQALAETNLSYTIITAPVAGRVTKLSGAKGTYLQPGQSITMFVPNDVWVTANFKETQLDLMRVGQPVDVTIDAFPEKTFRGTVNSIQSGSGTAFSLLPAENATGNYIKVVQRVPVKIVFEQPPDVQLGPGMSVVPRVKVR